MPPFRRWWIRNYRRTPYFWRQRRYTRRIRRRRPRKTILRRHRRRRRVRRFRFHKKLKKLTIKEWQPRTIRRCKIKGYKCLFMAGPNRINNNWAQYQETFIHPTQPGGGGWSYLIFSLAALWEEHDKCRNWWTGNNEDLPLARYMGCKFKFFRDLYTDYCVSYSLCYPMLDAPLVHANSSPYNMLLTRHRFIVPSIRHKPTGKRYIKKRFRPPSLLKNKWYFQADICKTGLILITTTAVDLDYFYLSRDSINNNISIWSLNYKIFQNNGFQQIPTSGYAPKNSYWLYCTLPGQGHTHVSDLVFLGKPGPFTLGKPYNKEEDYISTDTKWGNPFHPDVLNKEIDLYTSNTQPSNILSDANKDKTIKELITNSKLTKVTEPLVIEYRYNPDRDTGLNNLCYLTNITTTTNKFNPPDDDNITIKGFPLFISLWSWIDWQKKLAYLHNIDTTYCLTIQTKFTDTLKQETLIPIDHNFLIGKGPYGLDRNEWNEHTQTTWYPKVAHQLVTIDEICKSGPATAKATNTKSIQAHCQYQFDFKWGGCPAPMVNLTNPCLQPKFPVPDTILQRLQRQNPAYPPELQLHEFDERKETLTKKCIKRLQQFTPIEQTMLSITGTTDPPTKTKRQRIQEALQTSDSEEEEENLQQQLNKQRMQQKLLKRVLLKLINKNLE
nr:MAG: ORF1 [TTV-like mini virus]